MERGDGQLRDGLKAPVDRDVLGDEGDGVAVVREETREEERAVAVGRAHAGVVDGHVDIRQVLELHDGKALVHGTAEGGVAVHDGHAAGIVHGMVQGPRLVSGDIGLGEAVLALVLEESVPGSGAVPRVGAPETVADPVAHGEALLDRGADGGAGPGILMGLDLGGELVAEGVGQHEHALEVPLAEALACVVERDEGREVLGQPEATAQTKGVHAAVVAGALGGGRGPDAPGGGEFVAGKGTDGQRDPVGRGRGLTRGIPGTDQACGGWRWRRRLHPTGGRE